MGPTGRPLSERVDTESQWAGVGRGGPGEGFAAGQAAAAEAVAGRRAALVVVFASIRFESAAVLAGVKEAAPGAEIIGCTTAGEISTSGPSDGTVVVLALGGPGVEVVTAAVSTGDGPLRSAGVEVARRAFVGKVRDNAFLLLLTDGLGGDQADLVRGVFTELGAGLPLIGGCAGDDLEMARTEQFWGTSVLRRGVVGASVRSSRPFGIGVRHGWRAAGAPMLVTRSIGTEVVELDFEPALDRYLALAHPPPNAYNDHEAFTTFALSHPRGLRRREQQEVRFIRGADFERRRLLFVAEVPEGASVRIMVGDRESVLTATDEACDDALTMLGDHRPSALLVFDCVARRGVLGEDGIIEEVARLRARAAGAPVAGFYTYGEIARVRGANGFHNQTLVVLAIG